MAHIRALLGREGGGKGRVVLVPRIDAAQSVEIALPGGFNVTPRLAQALKWYRGSSEWRISSGCFASADLSRPIPTRA